MTQLRELQKLGYTLESIRTLPNGKGVYVIKDGNGEIEAEITRPCTTDEAILAARKYAKELLGKED